MRFYSGLSDRQSESEICVIDKFGLNPEPVTALDLLAASRLGIIRLVGNGSETAIRVAPLSRAGAGCLTFAKSVESVHQQGEQLRGAIVICAPFDANAEQPSLSLPCTILIAENPRLAFMRAVKEFFALPASNSGIHPTAVIHPTASVDPTAQVGAFCIIGAYSTVGAGSILYPNVVIYENVSIGERCIVNSGTVIGADGFGYERNEKGELEKFPHIGGVTIADDVEIGSNASIDRGSLGDTVIEARARIDNLVHVAHNVHIGEDAAVIALSMLGGSVRIGSGAWIAPGAVLMNQVKVGTDAIVGLGAVVVKNVAAGQTVMGAPAQDSTEFKATRAAVAKLIDG